MQFLSLAIITRRFAKKKKKLACKVKLSYSGNWEEEQYYLMPLVFQRRYNEVLIKLYG